MDKINKGKETKLMDETKAQLLEDLQELHALYIGECRNLSDDEEAAFQAALGRILNELDVLDGIPPANNKNPSAGQLGGSNDRSE